MPARGDGSALAAKTVLVVEDDPVMASALQFALEEDAALVTGPARRLRTAMREVERQRPDAAILDVELLDGAVYPLADRLREVGVPFVFYTAHAPREHGRAQAIGPVVNKSRSCEDAVEKLKEVLAAD